MYDQTKTVSRRTALKRVGAGIGTGLAGLTLADPAAASDRRKMVVRGNGGSTHYRVKIFGDDGAVAYKTESNDEVRQSGNYTIIDGYVEGHDEDVWWFNNAVVEIFAEVASPRTNDDSRLTFSFSGDSDHTSRDRVSFESSADDEHQEYYVEVEDSISKTSDCEDCSNYLGDCVDGNSATGYVLQDRDTYEKSGRVSRLTVTLRNCRSVTMSHY